MKNILKGIKSTNMPAKKGQIHALATGVLIAYAVTCIAFIGCALALTYTNLSENTVPLIIAITCVVSVFIAGFDASRVSEKNGWLWGLAAGAVYVFILFCILAWISRGFVIDARKVTLLVLSLASGGAGGVLGINFKK